jgi:hypothetical protein
MNKEKKRKDEWKRRRHQAKGLSPILLLPNRTDHDN